MAILDFTTSGKVAISLQGARFGDVLVDPHHDRNIRRFSVEPHQIEIEVHDMKHFSKWGRIQIVEEGADGGVMIVTVDSNAVGWFGTAQFVLHYENGQHIVSDNFQSAVGGMPNSLRTKRYNITSFRG